MTTYNFTAFTSDDLISAGAGGGSVGCGDTFTMPGYSTTCFTVSDNDAFLSGDSQVNENATDQTGQTASIEGANGAMGNGGQIYAEQWFWVQDQSGNWYQMIQIEQEGSGETYFTFYNGDGYGTPPAGAELTIHSKCNVTNDCWLDYKCLDGGIAWKPDEDCTYTIEAEDMQSWNFKTVHGDQASGDELVKITGNDGALWTTFGGQSGEYDIKICVQDETDGASMIKVLVDGHEVGVITLDRQSDGGGSNNGGFSEFVIPGIDISQGQTVEFQAWKDGGEYVRIDKIAFTEVKEQTGNVCGRLTWDEDCNNNEWNDETGQWDDGIGGQTIQLVDANGDVVAETTTRDDGFYIFQNVAVGDYKVKFPLLEGYRFSEKDSGVAEHFDSDANPDGLTDLFYVGPNQWVDNIDAGLKNELTDGNEESTVCENDGLVTLTNVLENTYDPEAGDPFVMAVWDGNGPSSANVGQPIAGSNGGIFVINADGSVTFDTNGDFDALGLGDSTTTDIWYCVQDAAGKIVESKYTVTVEGKEDIKAEDDCIIVFESETAGDIEDIEYNPNAVDSVLDNDVADGQPYSGAVVEVNGVEGNVGEFIDLAGGGRVKINADGTVDFDADGDFEALNAGQSDTVSVEYTIRTGTSAAPDGQLNYQFWNHVPGHNSIFNIPTQGGDYTGTVGDLDVNALAQSLTGDGDTYKIRYTGTICIEEAGSYDFTIGGDDGVGIWIDGHLVASRDGLHAFASDTGSIDLSAGFHSVEIRFFEKTGDQGLAAEFSGPDTGGATLDLIDFVSSDGFGEGSTTENRSFSAFSAGDVLFDQIDDFTVVGTRDGDTSGTNAAMIFDSNNPTGGDGDLGIGTGNILIISEDDDSSDPDDNAHGGTLDFTFNGIADLDKIRVVDIDYGETITFDLYDVDGNLIRTINGGDTGNGGTKFVELDTFGVARMVVTLSGSGAVDNLKYTLTKLPETKETIEDTGTVFIKVLGEDEPVGSIAGRYFCDENRNDLEESTEEGILEATVTLQRFDGTGWEFVAETQTDASDGTYFFGDLAADTYRVVFSPATGKEFVQPNVGQTGNDDVANDSDVIETLNDGSGATAPIDLAPGQDLTDIDAGAAEPLPQPGSISGRYFCDTNDNSLDDGQTVDPGVANVELALLNADGSDTGLRTMTDAQGNYTFADVAPGEYRVDFSPAIDGKIFVEQDVGGNTNDDRDSDANALTGITDVVTVGDGEDVINVDAGVEDPRDASISGRAFIDSNDDSLEIDDAGDPEAGLGGILVTLLDADGSATGITDLTEADGSYTLDGLGAGDYIVVFGNDPAGRVLVDQDVDGNVSDDIDSDANPADGRTTPISVGISEHVSDVDAGYEDPRDAKISGRYFVDSDGDALDNGEAGVDGILVTLLDGSGNPTGLTATTQNGGFYEFTGLGAGDYAVDFGTTAPGFAYVEKDVNGNANDADDSDVNPGTGITDTFSLGISQTTSDVDAGIEDAGTASIAGRYFIDANDNSLDDGEAGVADVLVTLLDENGDPTGLTTMTDSGGVYEFTGLTAGTYTVDFGAPVAGFVYVEQDVNGNANDADDSDVDPATGQTDQIVLAPGEGVIDVDAGVEDSMTASISGRYFCDENRDNLEQAAEEGIFEAVITLQRFANGAWEFVDDTLTDSDNGGYQFTNLAQGTYRVIFSESVGKDFVTPNVVDPNANDPETVDSDAEVFNADDPTIDLGDGATAAIVLAAGEDRTDVDAGAAEPPVGTVTGRYFIDQDGNALDDNEPGVPDVVVRLLLADGTDTGRTATTQADGSYAFNGVLEGNYRLDFGSAIAGFAYVQQDVNGAADDDRDSDVDPGTGLTDVITVVADQTLADVDAGVEDTQTASISGRYFCDVDGNSLESAADEGVQEATVSLEIWNGTAWQATGLETQTSSDQGTEGDYAFTGLSAGTYRVVFSEQLGKDFVTPNVGQTGAADPADDSDAEVFNDTDPSVLGGNGATAAIVLAAGEARTDVDAGIFEVVPGTVDAVDDVYFLSTGDFLLFNDGDGDPTNDYYAVTIPAGPGVLNNDSDPDGDNFQVTSTGIQDTLDPPEDPDVPGLFRPEWRQIDLNADGSFEYRLDRKYVEDVLFFGDGPINSIISTGRFTYDIMDDSPDLATDSANITINVLLDPDGFDLPAD